MGKSVDEICAEYELAPTEVHAALAYYFDHRSEIDRGIKGSEAFVAALKAKTSSALERKLDELRGE